MLTIQAVSAMTGLSADALRRAERLGLIPPAKRTIGGHRRWSPEDLRAITAALLRDARPAEAEAPTTASRHGRVDGTAR